MGIWIKPKPKTFIEKLDEFELTDCTVASFKKIFPYADILEKVKPKDTLEILDPKYPVCLRRVLLNDDYVIDINFADELYGEPNLYASNWFTKLMRSEEYLERIKEDFQ